MSAPAPVAPTGGPLTAGTHWIKWLVLAQLAYWGVFAVVAPVMNYDSQIYNVARLAIAQEGGLFGNHGWSSARQIVFPWTFDAVHYPFLFLHWGYCLPSFACLVGLLIIVHQLVAAATGSARQGWWCCLALLSLPTLVYQAANTKNDVAVVFGVACWFYAWRLWREERRRPYLFLMALALGFTAGAKSTGLLIAGLLGVYSLCGLRGDRPALTRFCAWMSVCIVLFGSVETYVNNRRVYGSPLGPPDFIAQNSNRDGLAGAAANFIRYCFSNVSVEVDTSHPPSPQARWMGGECRDFLRYLGLGDDLGYRARYGDSDATLSFPKSGGDAGSDFGPIGALAILGGFVFLLARPPSDALWKLAAAGFTAMGLVSYTVAFMVWNARFLVLPFTLLTVALTLGVLRLREHNVGRFVRSVFVVLAVFSSALHIGCALNQNPATLWLAIRHRPLAEMGMRPGMLEIVRDLRARANPKEPPVVVVQAGDDSWMLCIMEVQGLRVLPATFVTEESLAASRSKAGHAPIYALTVNKALLPAAGPNLTVVKRYAEWESTLYRWQPPASESP